MAKWVLAMTSIILFKLTLSQEVPKMCRKRAMSGGEELLCHNASTLFFSNPNLFANKIHKLICENCTLNTLDEATFNVTKNSIAFLYLISSKIYTIKQFAFTKFRHLRMLNLRNNSIADLEPKSWAFLVRLGQIDLSYNRIRIVINGMFEEVPNLNWLNLNHNEVYYIQPEAFRGLSNLRHLYLNNNSLRKLDGFIFKYLPNLLLLYLENNKIVEIDSFAFANLNSLNALYLNNNSISYLTQYNFKPLITLNDLQLRNNNLTEIQISSFNGLTNLKHLYLGNNRLNTVKRYGFVGLDNLRILDLINNDFEVFDLSFIDGMKSLNLLWLEQNRIANVTIDFKLDPLNYLHSLNINDNNLTDLNYKLLYDKAPNIKDIFIYNNSWKCDTLVDMFAFFQEQNVTLCTSPDCNLNKTTTFVEETCIGEEMHFTEDTNEDTSSDFVTDVGSIFKISGVLVVINLLVFL